MKKKTIVIPIVLTVIVVAALVLYYYHYESVLEEKKEEEAKKEASMPKPTDYCLITYEESTDKEKTWHTVIINSGQKPIYKAQCWKKYIHILDGFKASLDTDGKWYSKSKDVKVIAHPSMHFSDKPFETKPKKKTTTQKTDKKLADTNKSN